MIKRKSTDTRLPAEIARNISTLWETTYKELFALTKALDESFPVPEKQGVDVEEMMRSMIECMDALDSFDSRLTRLCHQVLERT